MKNPIKEIGIIPLILILLAIGIGSTTIYNCNDGDLCKVAGGSCDEGSGACCEGMDCVGGLCCVPTGDELVDGATEAECCSGRSKVTLSAQPFGRANVCCAGEGPTPGDNSSCCDGLTWHQGICYACMETNESLPVEPGVVPCCDTTDTQVYRNGLSSCVECPCGELEFGDPSYSAGQRCRQPCPEPGPWHSDATVPEACVLCENPDETNCWQVIVMTKGFCGDRDAQGARCDVFTVRTNSEDDAELCAAAIACSSGEFVTNESGGCDPVELPKRLTDRVTHVPIPPIHEGGGLTSQQVCEMYCTE